MKKLEIINFLGELLSKRIGISPPAARGLIKLAIKDQMGPFSPLESLSFINLKQVLENSLKDRLIKINVDNIPILIEELVEQLTKNQSLMVMDSI